MDNLVLAAAFNEWMRRYTETPESFQREWQSVHEFLAENAAGKSPSYGVVCAAYINRLVGGLTKVRRGGRAGRG